MSPCCDGDTSITCIAGATCDAQVVIITHTTTTITKNISIIYNNIIIKIQVIIITLIINSPVSELEDCMDERDEEDDSEMDLLLWMSTPTSSDRSSRRRLRYLQLIIN